ncbi:GAF and ANTAR domain-containing protein [Dactylosporangium sp. NBC_01737]|uniref:GAF and ANTAR domain-containing protein n=1 Tax=Dactylosporangium sp. NBC_01737 TaxID=2975959 RepID=UPI002E0DBEEC|nr:GAF and ANTAR domain-containing protein [Dactylosporangium sp. NBC_01737]
MVDLERACIDAVRALSASGVGVSVMADDGVHGMAAASDAHTAMVEDLQFTYGEGPCIDAFASGLPVLVSDLTDGAARQWPVYAPAVRAEGISAVFAFPLQIGAARLGVVDVLRTSPGPLSRADLGRALTVADQMVTLLLDGQERGDGAGVGHRAELFQAQGMVSVQLCVALAEAMVRIRAHAYAENRPLSEVAADIVARRLRFDIGRP